MKNIYNKKLKISYSFEVRKMERYKKKVFTI